MRLRLLTPQGERTLSVSDADLLGEGGEARVFRFDDLALKVFHAVKPKDDVGQKARALKLQKLAQFPLALPPSVIAPLGLLEANRGETVGYAMPAIAGAFDFARLSQRRFREGRLDNAAVQALHRKLQAAVALLHARGVVVGDLNDGNVLFRGQDVFLIDADSMQFAGLPCLVGHERFVDPRLYGVDLTSAPRFDAGTDAWALAVLLFSSLLYVHPFGGTHAALPTALRRAEAGHSVLRHDVTLPRLATPPRALSDDALHYFEAVFEKGKRLPLPDAVLSQTWTRCACGLSHARVVCPDCHALGAVAAKPAVRSLGRCLCKAVFTAPVRLWDAALQGALKYVFEDEAGLKREDGTLVWARGQGEVLRAQVAGPATWLCDARGGLHRVEGGRVVERAQTSLRGTAPVLAVASSACYREEGGWLIDAVSGARVGQVLEGQTRLWTGERLGLGFYRAGGFTSAFLLRTGRAGLKQLPGVTWQGRVVEAHAAFDNRHALLSVLHEAGGVETQSRWLFDESGVLLAQGSGGQRGRAALLAGRVVLATDAGLVALKAEQGHLLEATHFADTHPFVGAGDELLPQSDGSLLVVGPRDITQVSLT